MSMDFAPPPDAVVAADVARALAEDVGEGDVTAALLPDIADSAYLLCKQDAVVCARRRPGRVLRVSRIFAPVPRTAST